MIMAGAAEEIRVSSGLLMRYCSYQCTQAATPPACLLHARDLAEQGITKAESGKEQKGRSGGWRRTVLDRPLNFPLLDSLFCVCNQLGLCVR